jgi:hypothetical protein
MEGLIKKEKQKVMNKSYLGWLLTTVILLPILMYSFGTTVLFPLVSGGFVTTFYTMVCLIAYFWAVGVLGAYTFLPESMEDGDKKAPKVLCRILLVILLILGGTSIGKKSVFIHNTSIGYVKDYTQVEQNVQTLYDETWKSYKLQYDVANINKDVFIQALTIQMDARKDGPSVAWKWAHENTNIDYNTFSKFYESLSTFIASRRAELRQLEENKQIIAKNHNLLIDTFPHSLYNKVLRIKNIDYKPAFLSDSTNKVFSTGVENLK